MKKLWLLGLLPMFVACGNSSNSEPTQFDFGNSATAQNAENTINLSEGDEDEGGTISLQVGEDGQVQLGGDDASGMQVAPQPDPEAEQTAPGMVGKPNPPHGEPGHRCDIPVGTPLPAGGAPAAQAQPAAPQMQTLPTAPAAQQPVPEKTAPGMAGKPNPPHGEPGHRCDLPVGTTLPS